MNKIEAYQAAMGRAKKMRSFADSARKPKADKFGCEVVVAKDYLGFYGSSSASPWGDLERAEMAEQMRLEARELAQRAAKRLEALALDAAMEAEREANEVLAEVKAGKEGKP